MSKQSLSRYDYKHYHRDKTYEKFESHFRNIFKTRFNILNNLISKPGRILDIGTSTGTMLDLFKEDPASSRLRGAQWETWGVEPSEAALIAKEKGHRVIKDFFENAKLPKDYFDVVILNHTLEHMDDPMKVLSKVNKILKRNGIVLVDVPNAGGIGSKLLKDKWPYRLPKEHKHQFTRKHLESIFRNSGFNVIHFESRSGIFEFADPVGEIWESLRTLKKRFFTNLILFPYSLIATILNMGDSMSMVGVKQ